MKPICAILILLAAGCLPAYAEGETAPAGGPQSLENLRRFKQENPQEFQRLIAERKREIKARFQDFRQTSPEKYEQFRRQVSDNRMRRLERMRSQNPEAFQRDMQNRKQRFERMRSENPERFQKWMERRRGQAQAPASGIDRGGEFRRQRENFQQNSPGFQPADFQEGNLQKPSQENSEFVRRPDFRPDDRPSLNSQSGGVREPFEENRFQNPSARPGPRGFEQAEKMRDGRLRQNSSFRTQAGNFQAPGRNREFQRSGTEIRNQFRPRSQAGPGSLRPAQPINNGGGGQPSKGGAGDGSRRRDR